MTQILNFCDRLQFGTSWGTDIAKLIILYFIFKFVFMLFKVTSDIMKF